MARIGNLILVASALASQASARVLKADAGIDVQRMKVGEQATLTVQARVDVPSGTPWPELQLAEGLSVVGKDSSASTSRSISIINGSRRDENLVVIHFQFRLSAKKPGTYPVSISLEGKPLGQGQIVVEAAAQDVRTATILDKRTLYVGQQLPFTWRLTTEEQIQIPKFPDVRTALGNGFYSETRDSQQLQFKPVMENDKQTWRLDITGNLFPLRAGNQKLPSTSLEYRFLKALPPRNPMEAMMGRTMVVNGTARTEEIRLEILPVPESGRPATYQGGVGSFKIQSRLEKNSLRAGDGTTLILTLEGDGQPQASGTPVWSPPAGVETYPPQDEWTRSWKNGVLWTKLVRKIVLVPRQSGTVALDSVRFSWWDPEARKFQSAAIELPALLVAPAAEVQADTTRRNGHSGPMLSGWDRFWIGFGKISAVVWALALIGILVWRLVAWILVRRSRDYAVRKGLTLLDRRLSRLPKDRPAHRIAQELRTILSEALALRMGEEVLAYSSQELPTILRERLGWRDEDAIAVGNLSESLQACEFAGLELDPNSQKHVAGVLVLLRPSKKQ
ncbi:MAG: BatD family protein [Fibrobacterota bacterium]|nr:BatD family protein [Fibrobacterota bacterium]QQS07579.1 MAG: BatD family protein [Fibrobacterota bacterium]